MYQRFLSVAAITLVQLGMVHFASAGIVLNDDFNSNTSANYTTFITAGATGPSGDVTFAYNYGAAPGSGGLSIPAAPHTTDGSTLGLRIRTDNLQSSAGTVVGTSEIVTKNLSLGAAYKVTVDVWSNYIGGSNLSSSGTNGSTGVAVGVGTKGNSIQYIAANDGLLFEGFGDNGGGANQAYRVYTDNNHPNPTTKNYWAAGTTSTSASNTDPYYTSRFPAHAGPAGQSSFASTQSGNTAAGTLGFAWHTWTITSDGTNVVWAIDGSTITTVPVVDFVLGGSQISLGNDDTGLTGSSAANNQLFNAEIFDNLTVESVPEASAGLFGCLICGVFGLSVGVRKLFRHPAS
jgi:hypothetical protein